MVDAVQLLEGMERMLARRAKPIPVHVMRAALRVAAEALKGPPSPEQAVAQHLLETRAEAVEQRRTRRAPVATAEERVQRKRERQAAWKRAKNTRLRAAEAAEAAQVGRADAVAKEAQDAAGAFVNAQHETPTAARTGDDLREMVRARIERCGLNLAQAERQMGRSGGVLNVWLRGGISRPVAQAASAWLATPEVVAAPMPATPTPPTPASPVDPLILEPVPASIEDARDWLYEELLRERGKRASHAEIEARLALFTPPGLLAECNARRLRHGLPPYSIAARAA